MGVPMASGSPSWQVWQGNTLARSCAGGRFNLLKQSSCIEYGSWDRGCCPAARPFCLIIAGAAQCNTGAYDRATTLSKPLKSSLIFRAPSGIQHCFGFTLFAGIGTFRSFHLPHPTKIALTQEVKESMWGFFKLPRAPLTIIHLEIRIGTTRLVRGPWALWKPGLG